jgi:PRTRC genetic system protein A
MSFSPVGYIFAQDNNPICPIDNRKLYEYLVGGNGVFIRAQRDSMRVVAPVITRPIEMVFSPVIRGLLNISPVLAMAMPIPDGFLAQILEDAIRSMPHEAIYYGSLVNNRWKLVKPMQEFTRTSVQAHISDEDYTNVSIEIHSHNRMPAFFSGQDDEEESQGFRIYGVIGNLDTSLPTIAMRIGIYGCFWNVPAHSIFKTEDADLFLDCCSMEEGKNR